MLSSIFNISFFSGFGGMGLILLVVILYFKFPKQTTAVLKVIGCIVLFVALPISAVFGVVNINGYYSASGGIFGQIKDSLGLNVGKVSTDTFEVSGLNLRLDDNGEYTAVITVDLDSDDVNLSLDPNKDYLILVNGGLTTNSFKSTTGGSIALSADYTYSFSDYDREEVLKDTLKISFVVNKDNIVCRLSTSGGATARDLWKLYYTKNGMTFKFVETTYLPTSPSEGEGDTSQYCVLSFYDGDELVTSKFTLTGTPLTSVPTYTKTGYFFKGWSLDKVNVFDFSQNITQNLTFYALLEQSKMAGTYFYSIKLADDVVPLDIEGTFEISDNGVVFKGIDTTLTDWNVSTSVEKNKVHLAGELNSLNKMDFNLVFDNSQEAWSYEVVEVKFNGDYVNTFDKFSVVKCLDPTMYETSDTQKVVIFSDYLNQVYTSSVSMDILSEDGALFDNGAEFVISGYSENVIFENGVVKLYSDTFEETTYEGEFEPYVCIMYEGSSYLIANRIKAGTYLAFELNFEA